MKIALVLGLITLVFAACSGRRLPPGTPPPEYEAPIVTPWAPENADAGSDGSPPSELDSTLAPSPSAGKPELSLDAGAR